MLTACLFTQHIALAISTTARWSFAPTMHTYIQWPDTDRPTTFYQTLGGCMMPYGQLQQRQVCLSTTPYYARACRRLLPGLTHCIIVLFIMPIHEDGQNPYIIYPLYCIGNSFHCFVACLCILYMPDKLYVRTATMT